MDDLQKAKRTMLSLLIEFDRICKKHSIQYWINYGTLLGAVRHKGFIPWDDDIDVSMTRNEFKKFLNVVQKELPSSMFFQTKHTDKEFKSNMIRLRDLNSVFDNGFYKGSINGIFIDIFVMDLINSKNLKFVKFFRIYSSIDPFKKWYASTKHRLIHYFLSPLLVFKPLINYIRKTYLESNDGDVYVLLDVDVFGFVRKAYVTELVDIEFEGRMFYAPKLYTELLTDLYGDYMKLPPVSERVPKHHLQIEFLK